MVALTMPEPEPHRYSLRSLVEPSACSWLVLLLTPTRQSGSPRGWRSLQKRSLIDSRRLFSRTQAYWCFTSMATTSPRPGISSRPRMHGSVEEVLQMVVIQGALFLAQPTLTGDGPPDIKAVGKVTVEHRTEAQLEDEQGMI